MLNQPQPVFSYTIPYYVTNYGESLELFISEKTYESFLQAQAKLPITIISGNLHPIAATYGEATSTLFDSHRAIIIAGTKDIKEYSNEIMDMAIATELERIHLFDREKFKRYLYLHQTPELIKVFIDDLQQTLEDIVIGKRLIRKSYRIIQREAEIMNDILKTPTTLPSLKKVSPYNHELGLYLLNKMFYLYHVDETNYKKYKALLQPYYGRLFVELEQLLKTTKKMKFTSPQHRQKIAEKIFKNLEYDQYVTAVHLNAIANWELPEAIRGNPSSK
ncbi:hypothetical protein ACJ2A9_20200 [Anaerobacillus sp. MEB173]|uniref:hypothetical protein n=1 Tax=Anaerobacillus sp. MEB173 TaxID=3383345 RepID=UPI003F8E0F30